MTGILALTVPFIFVIVIEWLKRKERSRRYELQAEVYAKALENGQAIPKDAFIIPEKKFNFLSFGIICIATGIGISLVLLLMSVLGASFDNEFSDVMKIFASVGIIPFLIGIAFVIIHFLEKKKSDGENAK